MVKLHLLGFRALVEDEVTGRTPLSIDTYYAEVAEAAVAAGASIVNDVSGGLLDERMLPTVSAGCVMGCM